MLTVHLSTQWEQAGGELLEFVLDPRNWVAVDRSTRDLAERQRATPAYQRQVDGVRVWASVDVTPALEVLLRVGFTGPGLTLMRASDLLEAFVRARLPFRPNSEWQVEVDGRSWVHFVRRYTGERLRA